MDKNNYKILMVCKNIPQTYKGGIQTHTYELSKHLVNKGHQVSILMSGSFFSNKNVKDQNGIELIKVPYLPGRYIPMFRLFLDELFFNISAYWWILINGYKYDIIHMQGRSGFIYSLFPKKTPHVTTYHGLVSKENKSIQNDKLTLQYKIFYFLSKKIEKISLKRIKNIIVVSNSLKDDILEISNGSKNFNVIPNGVNVPENVSSSSNKMNIITFVGRVEKTKGVKDLVDAIEELDSNVKCVIIGDGEYKKEIEEYVESIPSIKNKIWFLGSLDSELVNKWISVSNMVVLPSYYETQGIVLLEANAYKKPVIATNINGINEIVKDGENGLLYEKGNVSELKSKIKTLINNAELSIQLGESGYTKVKEMYSWKFITSETEKVYQQIA